MPSVPIVPRRAPLSVVSCIVAAYRSVLGNPKSFFREMWPWLILSFGIEVIYRNPIEAFFELRELTASAEWWQLGASAFLLLIVPVLWMATWATAAVGWHRWILLGERRYHHTEFWIRLRELKFLVALLVPIMLGRLLVSGADWIIHVPTPFGEAWSFSAQDGAYITAFVVLVIGIRFILVFPLIALGKRQVVFTSWRMTRENSRQIFVLLLATTGPLYLLNTALGEWSDAVMATSDDVRVILLGLFFGVLDVIDTCIVAAAASYALIALRDGPSLAAGERGQGEA